MKLHAPDKADLSFDAPFPVFPLEEMILFPSTITPLHLFEPRYVQLARNLIDSRGILAMAQFREKPSKVAYLEGTPLLRRDVCLAQVVSYDKTKDGHYILLLYGFCRAHIASELPYKPYRKMYVTPYDYENANEERLYDARLKIQDLLRDLVSIATDQPVPQLSFKKSTPTKAIIDQVIDAICKDPNQRYDLLHEAHAEKRATWLIHFLEKQVKAY